MQIKKTADFILKEPEEYRNKKLESGISTNMDDRFYLISTKLESELNNSNSPLIIQINYKFEELVECTRLSVKLFPKDFEQELFSPY